MKMQKRIIISLALILGNTSALAHDCGEPDCTQRHNHSWQDQQRWDNNSDCAQHYNRQDSESRYDYEQSDCARRYQSHKQTSARWEREASRVLSDIEREVDALTQERYQQVEVDYARPSCRSQGDYQNRRCQKRCQ
ncbi:hypothetical protein PN36_03450 [Candidatus Thiomargarita nelsonii]|uniref:Secreted protein n=1 Tax=Candidatus Thiomargarita nelsonii TaxID=1003181 RepID=A0A4E0RU24_9GAMM|nr:hypothetical protein PN36_03450 [Candidatus Thiomargarita nelsonii]